MDGLTNNNPKAKAASAGQQKQFDLILGRARQMMAHNGEQWIAALKAAPVDAAVMMGTSTVRQMVQMSEKAGQKVDPAVLLHVGIQFAKDVAGIANACGAVPDDKIEPYLKDVMAQSMMEFLKRDAKDGLISPKDKQGAQGMLAKMQQGAPQEPATPEPQAQAPAMQEPEEQEMDAQPDEEVMAAELAAIRQRKGGVQ